ncbi:MAG: hypothetical protein J3K34DRAFT_438044, partial [Monoraphidium minutum]
MGCAAATIYAAEGGSGSPGHWALGRRRAAQVGVLAPLLVRSLLAARHMAGVPLPLTPPPPRRSGLLATAPTAAEPQPQPQPLPASRAPPQVDPQADEGPPHVTARQFISRLLGLHRDRWTWDGRNIAGIVLSVQVSLTSSVDRECGASLYLVLFSCLLQFPLRESIAL